MAQVSELPASNRASYRCDSVIDISGDHLNVISTRTRPRTLFSVTVDA
jgi:hypothetical protein